MADKPDYSAMVAQAEQAVASVKDPELKRVAFQKVLEDLLSSGTSHTGTPRVEPARPARKSKRRKASTGGSTGPKAYIEEMIGDGFFKKQKTIAEVKAELENRGHHIPLTSLSGPLQSLCQAKALRRQKLTVGTRQTFAYSNY